jgi:hypothetical protein
MGPISRRPLGRSDQRAGVLLILLRGLGRRMEMEQVQSSNLDPTIGYPIHEQDFEKKE